MKFENCKYDHLDLAERFLEMAEKFLPYARDESNKVDMMCGSTDMHACGTVACHGGYAGLALGLTSTCFVAGAIALAQHLGFEDEDKLEDWANKNSALWGNRNGEWMFVSAVAFDAKGHEIKLTHIIQKYLDVAKRLMEIKE